MSRMCRWICCLAVLLALSGCGSPEPEGPNPIQQLQMLIANLPDSATKPQRFESFFAAGSAPDANERMKYRTVMLYAEKATQEGDTAKVQVSVEDSQGKKLGEVEWTAVKIGADWKLQKAPLP